jgi:hypothetical protein
VATNLSLVTAPKSLTGKTEFWLSEPESTVEGDGDWCFAIYADKDVFLATFTYPSQAAALRASIAMVEILKETISVVTAET